MSTSRGPPRRGSPKGSTAARGGDAGRLSTGDAWSTHRTTLVLDPGGVSALAGQARRLAELRRRGRWPPQVPGVVLAERLTGDHRRDLHANRLLRACQVRPVDEVTAREAARLRTATRRASTVSAVDAVVAAFTSGQVDPVVVTSDRGDLASLVEHTVRPVRVVAA